MYFFIILISVFAAVAAIYITLIIKSRREKIGGFVKGSRVFWKKTEIIKTCVTYQNVRDAVRSGGSPSFTASVTTDHHGDDRIVFRSSHGWKAVLDFGGTSGDRYEFLFYFAGWEVSKDSSPYWKDTMLAMKQYIEALFINLDPSSYFVLKRI